MRFADGLVLLACASAAAVVSAATAADATCNVPANTLSLSCGGACSAFSACMLNDTSATTATCAGDVECFTIDKSKPSTYPTFTFLIPYDATVGDTAKTPYKSNSVLTKINKWTLPSTTTSVIIRGGSSLTTDTKGVVAKVEIADDFLVGNTQVTNVRLASMDLSANIGKLVPNFPPMITHLWLQNAMLTSFPREATSFATIGILQLDYNFITKVEAKDVIPTVHTLHMGDNNLTSFEAYYPQLTYLKLTNNKLTELPVSVYNLSKLTTLRLDINNIKEFKYPHPMPTLDTLAIHKNSLTTFDAYMPKLTTLDIAANEFTEFPTAIFRHAKLTALYMTVNDKLRNVTFTNEQANFIATLETFKADPTMFGTDCPTTQQTKVQGFTVCITGGAVNLAIIQGKRTSETVAIAAGTIMPSAGGNGTSSSSRNNGSSASGDAKTNGESSSGSHSSVISIAVGSAVGVVVVALIAGFVYWRKNKREESKTVSGTNYTNGTATGSTGMVTALWNDPDLLAVKLNCDDIQDVKKIGSGAFCDVWLVRYRNSQTAASKRLREVTRARTQEFIDEIKLVATLSHPCIVELIGAAWTKEADLQALFEYMDGGDLRQYLTSSSHKSRSWTTEKLQIAIDIAEALVYVHSFNPPLVHRDLKSRNVLLASDLHAKLTDFGVSRYRSEDNTMTAGVGTGKWLAPEVIEGSSDYGPAADIFSFGVVLSELDTHKLPYEDIRGANGNPLADVAMLQLVATGELRPSFLQTCPTQISELAVLCLSLRPEDRPSAPEVAYALRSYKKSLSNHQGYSLV